MKHIEPLFLLGFAEEIARRKGTKRRFFDFAALLTE
jgi:hypothetical protein